MLTRRSFIAGAALGAAAMLSPAAFAASATDKDPSAWIVELMNDTLNDIRKDPALVKADPTKVHTFVNNRIMPKTMLLMTPLPISEKTSTEACI